MNRLFLILSVFACAYCFMAQAQNSDLSDPTTMTDKKLAIYESLSPTQQLVVQKQWEQRFNLLSPEQQEQVMANGKVLGASRYARYHEEMNEYSQKMKEWQDNGSVGVPPTRPVPPPH